MTRLIDADAINPMRVPQSVKEMRAWIDSQPTVDALPYEYILNLEEELRQKARESESHEQKEFYLRNAEAIQRLLITLEVKGRGSVLGI